jgi:hypothetical protein
MAIIYSYPIVDPTLNDLVLGTDVDAQGKPTKNFTIQSIVSLIQGSATGLEAVLADSPDGGGLNILNIGNITGSGVSTSGSFADGTMTISSGTGTGFVSIQSTDFAGNLTGVVKAGSSIAGLAGGTDAQNVLGVTQNVGDNSKRLATTAYVMAKVDPSILTFIGTSGGNQTVNLAAQTFSILGTANQIESVGTAQKITFRFPTAGVTLPDGSVATTQALTDNSTDVATTAFVHGKNDAQDLDFTGDTGTSSVLLNSQTLNFEGTNNEVVTAVTAQKVKFSLPSSVTISGTYTGATFSGDLNGTVNTATTGTTQSAGDDSTKIATTEYVDNAAGSKTLEYAGDATGPFALNLTNDDLEFNGDSNITITAAAVTGNKGIVTVDLNNDVTITGTSKAGTFKTTAGTATWTTTVLAGFTSITSTLFVGALTGNASTATALASSGAIALTGDTVSTGGPYTYTSGGALSIATTIADTTVTSKVLTNLPTPTSAAIAASDTILAAMAKLQGQITGIPQGLVYKGTWNANTNTPTLASGTGITGEFYIVSVAGATNLDGITDWQVGDWAIFVEVGATDTWQKIDNTSAILGSGTANKIAKWTGSNTLATGLIADDGTTVTVGNSGNFIVEGNTTLGDADTDTTTVKGPAVFEETLRINEGISLGANTYGTAGQVLTSGGGSSSVNTWTTPTTGTVTSVALTETGNALTITGSPVTSSGTINIAGAGSASQYINGALDLVTFPTLDNYVSWTLAGDSGPSQTISSTNTATFAGGFGITTLASATDTLTTSIDITGADNAIAGLTAATPIATDTLWFNDISDSNTIRKATIASIVDLGNETLAQVLSNGNTTGGTDIAVSAGDDITFTSTSKAIFNSALQIINDGSNSYIQDVGTGDLRIDTNAFRLRSANGGETMITAFEDGAVNLMYNDITRLSTTNAGITVTGNASVNGNITATGSTNPNITVSDTTNSHYLTLQALDGGSKIDFLSNLSFEYGVSNTTVLRLDSAGAIFEDDVEIKGNLTVDGDIIHGGGKSGIFNGSKSFTGGAAAATLFRLTRTTTGALIFDVYLTSATSGYSCKKYTVAHKLNTAPNYNKIIDSGAATNGDYVVTFTNDGQGVGGDTVKCEIAATTTQDIHYTIQVGQGATAVTRYTS